MRARDDHVRVDSWAEVRERMYKVRKHRPFLVTWNMSKRGRPYINHGSSGDLHAWSINISTQCLSMKCRPWYKKIQASFFNLWTYIGLVPLDVWSTYALANTPYTIEYTSIKGYVPKKKKEKEKVHVINLADLHVRSSWQQWAEHHTCFLS